MSDSSRQNCVKRIGIVLVLCIVSVACSTESTPGSVTMTSTEVGDSSAGSADSDSESAQTWAEPEVIAPGVVLDRLGPIDTGVVTDVTVLKSSARTTELEGAGLRVDSCRTLAPGRWVLEGTATLWADAPSTGAIYLDLIAGDQLGSLGMMVTVNDSGDFRIGFNRSLALTKPPSSGLQYLENERKLSGCSVAGLGSGWKEIDHFETLPGWIAPEGSVQAYGLGATEVGDDASLAEGLARDVWLGVTYPFAKIWLPINEAAFGPLTAHTSPFSVSTSYSQLDDRGEVVGQVHQTDGDLHETLPTLAPIDGLEGWEWVESRTPWVEAYLQLSDGRLEILAPDREAALKLIKQLAPYDNLLSSRLSGPETIEAAMDAVLDQNFEGADPYVELEERGRFPLDDGVVVVFTYTTIRDCEGCSGRPEWIALQAHERSNGWEVRFLGGGGWDACLSRSSGSQPNRGHDTVILAGDPSWGIEQLVGEQWEPLDSVDGLWAEVGAPTSEPGSLIRAVDANGEPQPCD